MILFRLPATRRSRITLCNEQGFSIAEILCAMTLFAIFALGLAKTTILSMQMRHKSAYDSIASQLAVEKMEEFAGTDPSSLSDGDSWDESVSRGNMSFNRNSSVSVHSDGSRTVYVDVTAESSVSGSTVSLMNTFYLWGE
ncbi:MAG: prepilin-type N-terminal cleavage/methylation domain-containing protein [Bdellovibrionales bacterium]|nr:prepilin-type N-terminal cleavage/methylation domain-containing protein [Bdellovibrionales bacterium]